MAAVGVLLQIDRYVNPHSNEGKAVFSDKFDESRMKAYPDGIAFALSYTTKCLPIGMNHDEDMYVDDSFLNDASAPVVPGGIVLRHVDLPLNPICAMHRIVSLDYGVILEGEIELRLYSEERRLMKRGAVACCFKFIVWQSTSLSVRLRVSINILASPG